MLSRISIKTVIRINLYVPNVNIAIEHIHLSVAHNKRKFANQSALRKIIVSYKCGI